jgi:GntR family transcriptional regulator
MQLSIEPNNGIPIYEQLIRQIKYAVAEGVLMPGQIVPSVREMAKRLAVNPNTVQRAYLQLQQEQVLQSQRGRGVVVCDDAKQQCVADRQQLVAQRLSDALEEAVRSGLSEDRLRSMFETALDSAIRRGDRQL